MVPQSTQLAAISSALPQYVPPMPDLVIDLSALPARMTGGASSGKRGRPPKQKSPPPVSLDPISKQENDLLPLCVGPALRRALLLLRSFNAKSHQTSEADRVPPESLPAIIALVASRQLVILFRIFLQDIDVSLDWVTARWASDKPCKHRIFSKTVLWPRWERSVH